MQTLKATEAIKLVQETAEQIRNDAAQRFPEAASFGDGVRQGDLYITLIERVPARAKLIEANAQLVPGNTQGSRHCIDSLIGVTMYVLSNAGPLDGPIIKLTQSRTVLHPTHGHWILSPGIYQIEYQRDLAEEERRVMD